MKMNQFHQALQKQLSDQKSFLMNTAKTLSPSKPNIYIHQNSNQSHHVDHKVNKIGSYFVNQTIIHKDYLNSYKQQFKDYVCIKESRSAKKTTKKIESLDNKLTNEKQKKSLCLLCRVTPNNPMSHQKESELRQVLEMYHTIKREIKYPNNILFPQFERNQIITSQVEEYMPIDSSSFSSLIQNEDSFHPLARFASSPKIQSQLFCLNLFYRFVLNIGKPLMKLVYTISSLNKINMSLIHRFFRDILVIQNVFVDEQSNHFFLLCLNDRYQQSQPKSLKRKQKIEIMDHDENELSFSQIEKDLLARISQIFCRLFCPTLQLSFKDNHDTKLHTSFLANFLVVIGKGELKIDQVIEILQSKKKRKSFINDRINISGTHEVNGLSNGKKKRNQLRKNLQNTISFENETIQIESNEACADLNNIQIARKRRSVQRRLSEKPNTIDVLFQNYFRHKDVPPSFVSKSQEKKGKMFRHSTIHSSKGKQRSMQSNYEASPQQNNQTLNPTTTYSSSKKDAFKNHQNSLINSRYNFSFMKNTANDKFNGESVSRTIEIGERSYADKIIENSILNTQLQENDQKSNEIDESRFMNLMRTNPNSSKVFLRNSTQKLTSSTQPHPQTKNSQYIRQKISPAKQNSFKTVDPNIDYLSKISKASKIKNRRYYHTNNFASTINSSQISQLIQNQREYFKTKQNSRSRDKQLLSRSKQKALACFNREFKIASINNYNQQNMQGPPKGKSQNISSILKSYQKSDYQSLCDQNNSSLKNVLEKKQYSNHSRQFILNGFSPPKKKKPSNTQGLRAQFSSNVKGNKGQTSPIKIDDKQFRNRFSMHVASSINPSPIKSKQNASPIKESKTTDKESRQNVLNILKIDRMDKKDQEVAKNFNEQTKQRNQSNIIPNKPQKKLQMIQNQYLLGDQYPVEKVQKIYKSLDRSEKGFLNAAKKLNQKINNKNFNVQNIFTEQQIISKAQQQFRNLPQKLSNKVEIQKSEKQIYIDSQDEAYKPIYNPKNQQQPHFSQEEATISPIKHRQNTTSEKSFKEIQNSSNFQNLKPKQQAEQKFKFDFKPKPNPNNSQMEQFVMNQHIVKQQIVKFDTDDLEDLQKQESIFQIKKTTKSDIRLKSQEIKQKIEEVQLIERKPNPILQKMSSQENQEKSHPVSSDVDTNLIKEKQQTITPIEKNAIPSKALKKEPKKVHKLTEEEQFQLEEIKLAPINNSVTNNNKKNKKHDITSLQNDKKLPLASLSSKEIPDISLKPQLPPYKKADSTVVQMPLPPKIDLQTNQRQNTAKSSEKRQNKRQNTSQSSQASSYGPNKSVRRLVDEYVFLVNRIGQAVAKSPAVSKKVEKVCEWYVGVYFLYKRFYYERRKIQKCLKEGLPKLTRYEEEINLDEWAVYLKSPQRQALLAKVSSENINIGKSLQKMQGKLMGRKIPENIKNFAAISQRSSQQSCIAIDAVIDEYDCLVQNKMMNDQDILVHCTQIFNACLVVAELDQLVEDIVPILEFKKTKRSLEELETIAQDLYDLYHDE